QEGHVVLCLPVQIEGAKQLLGIQTRLGYEIQPIGRARSEVRELVKTLLRQAIVSQPEPVPDFRVPGIVAGKFFEAVSSRRESLERQAPLRERLLSFAILRFGLG